MSHRRLKKHKHIQPQADFSSLTVHSPLQHMIGYLSVLFLTHDFNAKNYHSLSISWL